ncbi:MAG: site-2 protease family protein [Deltaproteobacteria bacterium]|nr:site-2 protease family protein [Deltaproteobacteria bacterium]
MSDATRPPLPHVARDHDDDYDAAGEPTAWRLPLFAALATVASTFFVGALAYVDQPAPIAASAAAWRAGHGLSAVTVLLRWLSAGWSYAVPLLVILLCHELGHYTAARWHGLPTSLPIFLPFPLPPLGTLGAVIRLSAPIRGRTALMDVGASGPLAGLLAAVPIVYVGLRHSQIRPILAHGSWTEEGTSLLFGALKYLAKGPIPAGHEVVLHPTAMAGWVALFVTMLNLLPYGQLDGGHIAQSLLGRKSAQLARAVWLGLMVLALAVGAQQGRLLRALGQDPWQLGVGYTQGLNWLLFGLMIGWLHRDREAHPTRIEPLPRSRQALGIVTLGMLALLFMPIPLRAVTAP